MKRQWEKKHKFAVKKQPEKSKREEWIPNVCFVRFSDIKKKNKNTGHKHCSGVNDQIIRQDTTPTPQKRILFCTLFSDYLWKQLHNGLHLQQFQTFILVTKRGRNKSV